ncbi:O-methyltransferase [Mycobacterium sp. CBMA293]|uniref:O-methyltransferase n=1 Tax=unclassified Mycolicibacterium TaxID=2636767 RepID=UPI0012DC3D70|nr:MULTISPECIES: O-methyltransferase [unclassified Mycolicibacterium]MUL48805.1 O-methyltransferase [Mycolicibacterium sp. CBMA 360]MUL62260.1 O-methyltransferase [Mycolicibacterium sp. CBMA 335]MUL71720.1 O-methyltransferase [Mycolicibacterium sp. CBMA 311]MUL93675.1 O-methyltransferase [Mycolicibacterium sp. CBMA 230]MUM09361.1 SAM-dependent methyltransferase [Mycolicibacterium sp. CBMA 213]
MSWKQRWSFVRMALGMRRFTQTGQFGDGREAAAAAYVEANARRGDVDDVLATIDTFAREQSMLVNVGDEKGQLLEAALHRANPARVLELGTYCGYSSLLMARTVPDAHIFTVELSVDNAEVARRIWTHAGVADRITCVVGTIGDDGATLDKLAGHGFGAGNLDFMFIDHDKHAYLDDLQSVMHRGWLHPGAVVVADNIKVPGSPKYRAYMTEQQGKTWNTVEHDTHVEYQSLLTDLVLESDYLG